LNYLAHALLSQPHPLSLLGNLAGDHIKGRLEDSQLSPLLVAGLRRHRAVDMRSDTHPAYREMRALFPQGQRRFAGILLDVLFDHFLCRHWPRYCETELPAFRNEVYAAIGSHAQVLPRSEEALLRRWAELEWLSVYANYDGVVAVLERLVRRARRPLPLPALLAVAERHGPEFEAGFLQLFDDLLAAFAEDGRPDLRLPPKDHDR